MYVAVLVLLKTSDLMVCVSVLCCTTQKFPSTHKDNKSCPSFLASYCQQEHIFRMVFILFQSVAGFSVAQEANVKFSKSNNHACPCNDECLSRNEAISHKNL